MNFLFLRGLARHKGHWYGFEKNFQSKEKNNQILLLDTPGNGEYAHLESPLTIRECTLFLREKWLSQKRNGAPWAVIAISMGGMIALDWLSLFPEDFNKVFIINTSAKNVVMPWERFSLKVFFSLPYLLIASKEKQEETILDMTLAKRKINQAMINNALHLSLPHTNKINFIRQLISASHFELPSITDLPIQKIIFIVGLCDQLVSPKASQEIAKKLNCPLIINKESGHDLPLDDSHWLVNIIQKNLD